MICKRYKSSTLPIESYDTFEFGGLTIDRTTTFNCKIRVVPFFFKNFVVFPVTRYVKKKNPRNPSVRMSIRYGITHIQLPDQFETVFRRGILSYAAATRCSCGPLTERSVQPTKRFGHHRVYHLVTSLVVRYARTAVIAFLEIGGKNRIFGT